MRGISNIQFEIWWGWIVHSLDELCQINDIIPNSLQNNSYEEKKSSSKRLESYFESQDKGLLTSIINSN